MGSRWRDNIPTLGLTGDIPEVGGYLLAIAREVGFPDYAYGIVQRPGSIEWDVFHNFGLDRGWQFFAGGGAATGIKELYLLPVEPDH